MSEENKINWETLKHEWMTTDITLVDLAEKYNIPYFQLRAEYNISGWWKALSEYSAKTEKKFEDLRNAKSAQTAEHLNHIDQQVLVISQRSLDMVEKAFAKTGDPETKDDVDRILALLNTAAAAVKAAHGNARLSGNKPTSITRDEVAVKPEDLRRIEEEFGHFTKKSDTKESTPDSVAGDKPPQDSQE